MERKLLHLLLLLGVTCQLSAQNVGIGTNNPTEKLDVNGTVKASGFKMSPGATTDYVLRSDASGNATWVDPVQLTNNGVRFHVFNDTITATDTLIFVHPVMGWKVSYKLTGTATLTVSNTNSVLNDDCIVSGIITNNNSPNTNTIYLSNGATSSISVTNNFGSIHNVTATVIQKHAPHGMKIEMSETFNYISGLITYW